MARARENRRQDEDVIDLQLERGQVTTLGVGAILALGAMFLLGVGFGRQVAPTSDGTEPVADVAGPAEAAAAPALTFHDALTSKRVEPASPPAPTPAAAPEEAPEQAPKEVVAEAAPSEAVPAERVAAREATEPAQAAAAPSKPTSAPAKAEPAAKPSGTWAVQVASSQQREHTASLVKRLSEAGYSARVVEAEIPGRGTWYRVRVGKFTDKTSATLEQAEMKVALGLAGIVVSE